jgi:hypothetical protein
MKPIYGFLYLPPAAMLLIVLTLPDHWRSGALPGETSLRDHLLTASMWWTELIFLTLFARGIRHIFRQRPSARGFEVIIAGTRTDRHTGTLPVQGKFITKAETVLGTDSSVKGT